MQLLVTDTRQRKSRTWLRSRSIFLHIFKTFCLSPFSHRRRWWKSFCYWLYLLVHFHFFSIFFCHLLIEIGRAAQARLTDSFLRISIKCRLEHVSLFLWIVMNLITHSNKKNEKTLFWCSRYALKRGHEAIYLWFI